jgi:hypothetical protein
VVRLKEDWSWRDDSASPGGQYRADVTRSTTSADGSEDAASTVQQTTTVRRDQLTIGTRARGTASPGQWKSTVPPQYVPGQLLPLLMGKLSSTPMLLRAESFVTSEAPGAPEPLTILIRPATNTTRKAEGDPTPLRCLTAEVNGSGRVSRWYFTSGGEVECVELPGGVQRVPSDGSTIGFDFGREPGMAP